MHNNVAEPQYRYATYVPNLFSLKLCQWVNKLCTDSPTQSHRYQQYQLPVFKICHTEYPAKRTSSNNYCPNCPKHEIRSGNKVTRLAIQ